MMSRAKNDSQLLSRRTLLKGMGLAPLLLRPSPFYGYSLLCGPGQGLSNRNPAFPFSGARLTPHYPAKSPLADVLRLVTPGSDEYVAEKYAVEIETIFKRWSEAFKASLRDLSALGESLDPAIEAISLVPAKEAAVRSGYGIDVVKRQFGSDLVPGRV